jgi:SecD/SecF fusion protein
MNVVLQVSIEELIKALADHSADPTFLKALSLAKEKQKANPQADLVTMFQQPGMRQHLTGNWPLSSQHAITRIR